jgi:hypothetical protein
VFRSVNFVKFRLILRPAKSLIFIKLVTHVVLKMGFQEKKKYIFDVRSQVNYCKKSQRMCWVSCTRWRSWLRHCATSRKVAVSIPDVATEIFHWLNPSGRTMALGSTQPRTEMSTRYISCGLRAAGAYGWQPYHLHVPIVLKSGSLSLLEPSGPVQG